MTDCPVCGNDFDAKVPFDGVSGLERTLSIEEFNNACIYNGKSGYCSIYLHDNDDMMDNNYNSSNDIDNRDDSNTDSNTLESEVSDQPVKDDEYGEHASEKFNYQT